MFRLAIYLVIGFYSLSVNAEQNTDYLINDHYSQNVFGGIGLIETPSARFSNDGEFGFGISSDGPYNRLYAKVQFFPWMEATLKYTEGTFLPYGPDNPQTWKDKGFDIKIGKFPFSASGKASASGKKDGFVKVIFDSKYGEWLGCHMIGAGVTDMIAEAVLGRKLETTGQEVLKTIHPHPTMSEAIMEAVADAYDEVIHL